MQLGSKGDWEILGNRELPSFLSSSFVVVISADQVESFGKCPTLVPWPAMICGMGRWWNCDAHILGTRAARHLFLVSVSAVFATTLSFRILLGLESVACHVGITFLQSNFDIV